MSNFNTSMEGLMGPVPGMNDAVSGGAKNAQPGVEAKMANFSTPFTTPFGNDISSKPARGNGDVVNKTTEDVPCSPANFNTPFNAPMGTKK